MCMHVLVEEDVVVCKHVCMWLQVGLGEVHHIGEIISPMAGPGCSIKYGAVNDPSFEEDELQVTLM